ncbi:PTS sugar transporter subunit IIC/EAL domain-containing protein [Paraburkholderia phosphatilytica]|uniref:PTS sugar transporter subunit IIC/EAL domain-containing protein n=1 Tax=Paraburkholderia phosphatilytica TaxID=2282883 RepID=UPI000E515CE7|nr:EAL domain-containing protein [Paraburkholderia phosphatilytica]
MTDETPARSIRLLAIAERIDRMPLTIAIRRGLALPLPLIMTGALTLLLRYPPTAAISRLSSQLFGPQFDYLCDSVIAGTFGIGSLVALFGFAYALTQLHNQRVGYRFVDPTITVVVALSCFFTIVAPVSPNSSASLMASLSIGQGLFQALLIAILSGSLFLRLCSVRYLRIPFNRISNDTLVGDVFTVLPAAMVTVLCFVVLKAMLVWVWFPVLQTVQNALVASPVTQLSNSLVFGLAYETATQVLWLFGIHGPNALYAIQQHVLAPAADANVRALASGATPPFIFTFDFFSVFARMGGSGGTLSLIVALLAGGRTRHGRKLALFMLVPALCNVNEPLLFGLPLVLNPVYAIPFILAPCVQVLIAWLAIVAHLMPKAGYSVVWTTPALYSGYAATGSFAGVLVQLLALAAGTLIYIPFVRIAEDLARRKGKDVLASLLRVTESPDGGQKLKRCLDLPGEEGRMAMALASDLHSAVDAERQMFLEFQPQIDSRTGRVFGAEALLRWEHPSLGRVPPPVTIALADDVDQIDRLGMRVLTLACRQRVAWRDRLPDDFTIAVNLSPRQLTNPRFHDDVIDMLHREQLSPTLLELEITESTVLLPDVNTIGNLRRLREAGVKIALDDFGMGHTSLHYLRELPLDTVKIDRSLADVKPGSVNEHIIRSIAELSRTLNLLLVVEGVETERQLKSLSALGCHRFQGYFFARPLAAGICADFVDDAHRESRFAMQAGDAFIVRNAR